jgi:flagellar motility protein MotE (MotC chaperone)
MQFPSPKERGPGVWLIVAAMVVGGALLVIDQGNDAVESPGPQTSSLTAAIEGPALASTGDFSFIEESEPMIAQVTPEPPSPGEGTVALPEEVELPPSVRLPPAGTERCEKALGVYRARLRARQRTLAAAKSALEDEKIRVEEIQEDVEQRFDIAKSDWELAESLAEISNLSCAGDPPNPADLGGLDLGLDKIDPEERVKQVVAIIKSMKPAAAAAVIERWNHPLATTALSRLSPRIASKIIAEMPQELATRLTVDMLKGKELPKRE